MMTEQLAKAGGQAQLVVDAFANAGVRIGVEMAKGGVDYLYESGYLLVRSDCLRGVREVIGGGEVASSVLAGVSRLSLGGAKISKVPDALAAVDAWLGPGAATPNHVLSVAPGQLCLASEPMVVPPDSPPSPGVRPGRGGDGISICMPDTGVLPTSRPWLAGVTGDLDRLLPTGSIPPYAGHGTFVAGLARCMAPRAKVHVLNVFSLAGATLESDLARRLDQALERAPDIISLSAGGTSRRDLPLLSVSAFLHRFRGHKKTVVVAAAGNNVERRPFWPAACPGVVSVGALSSAGRRASFTGFGSWIDVYAPGENLVNAFASGVYTCGEAPFTGVHRRFDGMARWSGTSFATPLVAGLIADRMSRTGENARLAVRSLLWLARQSAAPGVGPVLLP